MNEQELKNNLLGLKLDTTRITKGNFDAVFLTEHDASEIIACFKQANYVRLADDQSLPEYPELTYDSFQCAFEGGQQRMLGKGWRKVDL